MKLVKYKLTLIEKKIQLDSIIVEVDEEKPAQLINHMRQLKIRNTVYGIKRAKIIKEIIS